MTLILTTAFAALAVVAAATAVALVASAAARRALAPHAVAAASAVTGTMTLGSLYLSEVAGYVPCELCWVQRIFAYSLATTTTVALLRRRADVMWHATSLAALGLATSLWHVVVQRIPAAGGTCDPTNPCSAIYVERFGFITIPTMAAAGFALVLALALTARAPRTSGGSAPATADPTTGDPVHDRTPEEISR